MKLALFISDMHQNFAKTLIKTMEKYVQERNVELHIFASFGLQDNNVLHAEGQKSILYLPNLNHYQCIMVAGDTMARYDMHNELMGYLRRNATCPILGIRHEEAGYFNVLVHNQAAMCEMTKHFIYEHGFKDICFVTGRMQSKDAVERLAGYKEAMLEADIRVTSEMIFEGDYWRNKGREIVDYFRQYRGGELPQAIVCSNDYMALSVCDELIKRGYRIPEDVCVSGFDDLDEAQMYIPPLTTVRVQFDRMAVAAVDMAISLANGQALPNVRWCESGMHYRGTCGCNKQAVSFQKDIYHRQMLTMRYIAKQAVYMQTEFNTVSTEEECFECLQSYLKDAGVDSYYVCLKKQNVSQEELDKYLDAYNDELTVRHTAADSRQERAVSLRLFVDKEQGAVYEDILFDKQDILPAKYVKNLEKKACIITPIHSLNEAYGYIVFQMSDDTDAIPNERFELLCLYFGDTLRRIYMYQNLLSVREAMHLYLRDPLTDIFNRRGFEQQYVEMMDASKKDGITLAIVSVDMDDLKEINDRLGHQCGDAAICSVANALSSALHEGEMCARIGGDEFEAILRMDSPGRIEAFQKAFGEALKKENEAVTDAYVVGASVGVCVANQPATMAEYMHRADVLMYEEKKRRHKEIRG